MTTEESLVTSEHVEATAGLHQPESAVPAPPARRSTSRRPPRATKTKAADADTPPAVADVAPVPQPAITPEPTESVGHVAAEKTPRPRRSTPRARKTAPVAAPEAGDVVGASIESEQPVRAASPEQPDVAPEPPSSTTTTDVTPPKRPSRRSRSSKKTPAPEPVAVAEVVAAPQAVEDAHPASEGDTSRASEGVSPDPVSEPAPKPTGTRDGQRSRPARSRRPSRQEKQQQDRQQPDEKREPETGSRIVWRSNGLELLVKGEPVAPMVFFGDVGGPKQVRNVVSEVQRSAKAGIEILSTLIELTCPLPPDDTMYEAFDARMDTISEGNPKAWLMPRIVFVPAANWRAQYPGEVNHYAKGVTDDPSVASDYFWDDVELALRGLLEHVQRTTYGERIIGYHLERGEWFHSADAGYERSFANREGFRKWLRAKYQNNEVALRAAWFDGSAQFYTADIPPIPREVRPDVAFFDGKRERRWTDFLEYTSDVTANRLVRLSTVVKQATDGKALVSVCYGYTYEFAHAYSGHLALGRLLAAPSIDLVCGPPSYRDRQAGGAGAFPCPPESLRLHGKAWLSEDDTKTHLAASGQSGDEYNPRMDGRNTTEAVHARGMAQALVHDTFVGWMDLWGEGWLDADDIWSRIGEFKSRRQTAIVGRRTSTPEVIALVDEQSLVHIQRGDGFIKRILHGQRDALMRMGASVGYYLQSDLTHPDFPTDAKLYVFLNAYRLPADQREVVRDKLQKNGKTILWIYAVGVCDDRTALEESANEMLGISLRRQSWGAEVGSKVVDGRHPITQGMFGRELGVRERLNPSFYVDDDAPGLTVLAEYQQTGLPSVACRQRDGWTTVFYGEPAVTPEFLRGVCRHAGVHLYTSGIDDIVFAGGGWLALHTGRDGNRTLHTPRGMAMYDMAESRLAAEDGSEYRTFVRGKTTRLFYVGTLDQMRQMGLKGAERGASKRKAEPEQVSPADQAEPAPDAEPDPPILPSESEAPSIVGPEVSELIAAVDADIDDLADADDSEVDGLGSPEAVDEAGAAQADEAERKRRRRRRGGRGRGHRRRSDGGGEGASPAPQE